MSRAINVFTSMVFVYSLIVCVTCKQFSPAKVGAIENEFSFTKVEQKNNLKTESKGSVVADKNKYNLKSGYTFIKK